MNDTTLLLVLRGNTQHYPAGTIKDGENVGGQFADSPYSKSAHPSILNWEQQHANDPKENIYITNPEGGVIWDSIASRAGTRKVGHQDRVATPMQYATHMQGAVYTHNHPFFYDDKGHQQTGPGLSPTDIGTAARYGVSELRAVDRFHVFSLKLPAKKELDAIRDMHYLGKVLTDRALNRLRAKTHDSVEANALFADELGRAAAKQYGGTYSVYDRATGAKLDSTPLDNYRNIRFDATKVATPEQLEKKAAAAAKRKETLRTKKEKRLAEVKDILAGFKKAGW